jgi:hypothetical protein
MPAVTLSQIAEWRRALREEGDGELLDPTLAQQIAPRLMEEVERLHAELARARRQPAAEEGSASPRERADPVENAAG